MSYRNITVDDRAYQFSSGRTHTKVRSLDRKWSQVFLNSEWGVPVGGRGNKPWTHKVSPADVRGMILGKKAFEPKACPRHPDQIQTGLTVNPFSYEIRGRRDLMTNCPECVEDVAYDI